MIAIVGAPLAGQEPLYRTLRGEFDIDINTPLDRLAAILGPLLSLEADAAVEQLINDVIKSMKKYDKVFYIAPRPWNIVDGNMLAEEDARIMHDYCLQVLFRGWYGIEYVELPDAPVWERAEIIRRTMIE
jgi:hypothetical protein